MKINSDFKDLLRSFNAAGVRYLIVGGYAVMVHTEPRYTKDLDICVEPVWIDIMTSVSGLDFESAWARKVDSLQARGRKAAGHPHRLYPKRCKGDQAHLGEPPGNVPMVTNDPSPRL
jgi:hypothetical protein